MRQRLHAAALASTASTASTTGTTGTNPSIARTHAAFAKLSEPLRLLGLCARQRRLLRQLCGAESQGPTRRVLGVALPGHHVLFRVSECVLLRQGERCRH